MVQMRDAQISCAKAQSGSTPSTMPMPSSLELHIHSLQSATFSLLEYAASGKLFKHICSAGRFSKDECMTNVIKEFL
ncbi:hypothetical protein PanWU01x14_369960 [Parasponia andersonii]|uniref:Uncharacterized protein n=1 Tax=Parasponia andersonii TaxID=3476 RepID=A0A2P5A4F5_PARAD|nr:hypothetical protein PanWU01x14_369960 [Parasponia andersonii]